MVKKEYDRLGHQPQNLLSNMGAKVRQSHTSYTGSRSSIAIRHIGHFVHLSEQILKQQEWHMNMTTKSAIRSNNKDNLTGS